MTLTLLKTGDRVTRPGEPPISSLEDFGSACFNAIHTLQQTVRERNQRIAELEEEMAREVHMRDLEISDLRREVDEAEARCDALRERR